MVRMLAVIRERLEALEGIRLGGLGQDVEDLKAESKESCQNEKLYPSSAKTWGHIPPEV